MSRAPRLEDLAAVRTAEAPVLTPDGSLVVHVVRSTRADGGWCGELWVCATEGSGAPPRRLTSGSVDSSPALAPDGRTVAFVRRDGLDSTLCTIDLDGGPPRPLTSTLRLTGGPVWSPNGSMLAVPALVDDAATEPAAPLVIDGDPEHKVDGMGWIGTARTQVHVVDPHGGEPVQLTWPGSGHCSAPSWSPDGSRIAVVHTSVDQPAARVSRRVGLLDPARPEAGLTFPFAAHGAGGPLVWTPDGTGVIAVGTVTFTASLNRLIHLDVASGEVAVLAADLDRNVMVGATEYPGGAPAFASDGWLYFCVRDGGQTVLCSVLPGHEEVRRHDLGEGTVVSALSVTGSRAVVRLADPVAPAELALVHLDTTEVVRLTAYTAQSLPDVAFLPTTPLSFETTDGLRIHGWLLRDPATTGPAPTLVDIHGGPHNAWTGVAETVHLYHQVLASRGWNVVTLNPRGSDGYGEEFFRAALLAWGEADERDFLEPLDALVADGLADPGRLALAGYSYGGFMTCWLTTVTGRFRAAVAGGLVCDHRAMSASSDMGAALHDLEIGAAGVERLSPLGAVDAVSTPTLVLHGHDDLRCPLAQAELWFTALRDQGVPTRLVAYPGGAHGFFVDGPLSHRLDFNARIVEWVERHTL